MKLYEISKKPIARWTLLEGAGGAEFGLPYVEDLLFSKKYAGALEAMDFIDSVREMLAKGTGQIENVSEKWDGSPAIVCGTDPEDGKFFVAIARSMGGRVPKIVKSERDIANWYGDRPELAEKLSAALRYLPEIGIQGVIKGDLMFTRDMLVTENIDGQDYITFTPNTITYAVPVGSKLAARIARAHIGMAFHTRYEGETVPTMNPVAGNAVAGLTHTASVWFDDADYSDYTGIASLTPEENQRIESQLAAAVKTLTKIGPVRFDQVLDNTEFSKHIKDYINRSIDSGEHITNPTSFLQGFVNFYKQRQEGDIANMKSGPTSAAATRRREQMAATEQFISDNMNTFLGILAVYKRLVELKMAILAKLNTIDHIGHFVRTDDGYRVTAPEGFVVIGHDFNRVKLIDRLEFSRLNRAKPR
jgi:hypothetical protein